MASRWAAAPSKPAYQKWTRNSNDKYQQRYLDSSRGSTNPTYHRSPPLINTVPKPVVFLNPAYKKASTDDANDKLKGTAGDDAAKPVVKPVEKKKVPKPFSFNWADDMDGEITEEDLKLIKDWEEEGRRCLEECPAPHSPVITNAAPSLLERGGAASIYASRWAPTTTAPASSSGSLDSEKPKRLLAPKRLLLKALSDLKVSDPTTTATTTPAITTTSSEGTSVVTEPSTSSWLSFSAASSGVPPAVHWSDINTTSTTANLNSVSPSSRPTSHSRSPASKPLEIKLVNDVWEPPVHWNDLNATTTTDMNATSLPRSSSSSAASFVSKPLAVKSINDVCIPPVQWNAFATANTTDMNSSSLPRRLSGSSAISSSKPAVNADNTLDSSSQWKSFSASNTDTFTTSGNSSSHSEPSSNKTFKVKLVNEVWEPPVQWNDITATATTNMNTASPPRHSSPSTGSPSTKSFKVELINEVWEPPVQWNDITATAAATTTTTTTTNMDTASSPRRSSSSSASSSTKSFKVKLINDAWEPPIQWDDITTAIAATTTTDVNTASSPRRVSSSSVSSSTKSFKVELADDIWEPPVQWNDITTTTTAVNPTSSPGRSSDSLTTSIAKATISEPSQWSNVYNAVGAESNHISSSSRSSRSSNASASSATKSFKVKMINDVWEPPIQWNSNPSDMNSSIAPVWTDSADSTIHPSTIQEDRSHRQVQSDNSTAWRQWSSKHQSSS
ncbi:hypothetical protein BDB01DRAFT_783081 [Pilobolus umbonatus]|nr:hypothetical protein BDB01DRAFT_783081 [Pilobolus umbonatus]